MGKLTDAQKDQARSMFKDGKRCNEIVDFLRKFTRLNWALLHYPISCMARRKTAN
jgi:hypothetical protein